MRQTRFLSIEQVLAIHDQVVKQTGGSLGVRDIGLLDSAVARPQSSFGGHDQYVTIFQKVAALLHSLLKNHAFIDGNKRTALTSAGIFLKINEWNLINSHKAELNFALDVANNKLSLEDIADWLQKNSKRV